MLEQELCILHNKNMKLRAYLDQLPRGETTLFAAKAGISPVYLSQLAARQDGREPSPELCLVIWRTSNFKVTREELRPDDYWLIWPDLIEATAGKAVTKDSSVTTTPNRRDPDQPRERRNPDAPDRRVSARSTAERQALADEKGV